MNFEELYKLIYDFIVAIFKYFSDLCCKKKEDIVDAKQEIKQEIKKEIKQEVKEEIQLEQQDEINYDNSFTPEGDNDKQIELEEIAEEVIERIMQQYILLKKEN